MPNRGFTLVEILITMAVLGILVGIGFISFLGYIRNYQADEAAAAIAASFAQAKNLVRTTNKDVTIKWNTVSRQINITQGTTVVRTTTLDVTDMSATCRAACTGNSLTLLAPHGALPQDVKFVVTAVNRTRNTYLLGPTAVVKVTRP